MTTAATWRKRRRMKDFRDQVVAISGAGSGIGRALAHEFSRRGSRLCLSDLVTERLEQTAAGLVAGGLTPDRLRLRTVDVGQRDEVFAWAEDSASAFGSINVLINNAGVALRTPTEAMTASDLDWLMRVNLGGVLAGCQAFLPHLRSSGEGHLVNIASVFGLVGVGQQAAYSMSKFAVRGLSDSLAVELAGSCVDITCAYPGGIKTRIALDARYPGGDALESVERFDRSLARNTPEYCARKIAHAAAHQKRRVLVGADATLLDLLARLLPGAYQRIIARFS